MPKLDICDLCHFYAHDPHMVCAIHPSGIDGQSCLDYQPNQYQQGNPMEWWAPVGGIYYGGELILDPVKRYTDEQRLALLDAHPLFTGRCPHCEMPIRQTAPARVHWDCSECGWVDESL